MGGESFVNVDSGRLGDSVANFSAPTLCRCCFITCWPKMVPSGLMQEADADLKA